MKAEELRIGNLVQERIDESGGWGIVTIESILGSTLKVFAHNTNQEHLIEFKLQRLEGIPLTPEILERCGAIKLPRLMRNSIGILIDGETAIEYRMEPYIIRKLTLTIAQENSDMQLQSIEKVLDIDYLHQLQNLYWCLCGTELTFKTGSAPTLH